MKRIVVVLGTVLASGLLATSTASAGNWEETLLDPTPATIERGVTYTFGYWILQHGSYPYRDGDLGPTALLATDERGEVVEFAGTESRTAGHYSAEVRFPHDGVWWISSKHEALMADTFVATVTVPGGVRVAPTFLQERAPYDWGEVRPSFPPPAVDENAVRPGAAPPRGATPPVEPMAAARGTEATAEPGTSLPVGVIILGGVATVGFAGWLARRYARGNR